MANALKKNLEGKYLLFKEDGFRPEYRARQHRIGLATGGFGCSPHTSGSAIFVEWADGGRSRKEGYEVEAEVSEIEFNDIRSRFARPVCPDCSGEGWIEVGVTEDGGKRMHLCTKCLGEGVV